MSLKKWIGRGAQQENDTQNNQSPAPPSGPDGAFTDSQLPLENDGHDGDPLSGENKTMSGLVDTLEKTRAYDDGAEYSPE